MPSFQEIFAEVQSRREESSQDYVLKKYLKRLYKYSKRPTILYVSAFNESDVAGRVLQLGRQDVSCFMAAAAGADSRELDLILHSPGGPVEAAVQIATYLRRRFDHIRIIVPVCALSSATLLSCAADRIVLAEHASLGPIDPIVNWSYQGSSYSTSAQTLVNEFSIAQRNVNNKKNNPTLWLEKLKCYPPGFLATCKSQIQLSQEMAKSWLQAYMLRGEEGAGEKAERISAWLADVRQFVSSRRPLMYDQALSKELKVELLEDEQALADDVMAVFYAAETKFRTSDCVKIIVNHLGKGCTFSARQPVGPVRDRPQGI
jgi:ATP-dependent protease ClpP protease subunit